MTSIRFIGAGPGDPDLLTLRGAGALKDCRTVFAPPPFEETFAEHLSGKEVLVPFDFYFAELTARIEGALETGPVGFLVPGDLAFYSPFQALIDHFGNRATVVPGVGTANAASARLKKTLDLPGVCSRTVLVSPRALGNVPGTPTLEQLAAPGTTLVIYMNNLPLAELAERLRKGFGKNVPIALLHRLDLPGEEVVVGTLDDIVAQAGDRDLFNLAGTNRGPALTLVIVGETLAARADAEWWDYRREHIWRFRGAG